MIKWILIIVAACIMHKSLQRKCDIPAYYWRDYYGKMPPDALKVGTDANRVDVFIAQFPIATWLSPAKVTLNSPFAYVEYLNEEYKSQINVKVLCTQHPEYFEWIKTSCVNITNIKGKHLVIGGYTTRNVFIGRVWLGEELLVGRLTFTSNIKDCNLAAVHNNMAYVYYDFDVLAYYPVIHN